MERDSLLYKVRRKCQVIAHRVLPHLFISSIYSLIVLKKWVNIKNPKTFNEKILWMNLYYYPYNSLVIACTDKFLVRNYIKAKGLESLLVPLLGVWDVPEKINWNTLPQKFVLKCNHGCAYNILCSDIEKIDRNNVVKQLRLWLDEDFGEFNTELHYSQIKNRKIICEEFLGDCITDYKFFCFNGEPKYIYVSRDLIHDRQAQIGFFYMDGSKMPMIRTDYKDISNIELPKYFDDMRKAAEILCKDFPFVRVDFFIANDRFYFAELTFTPSGGMMPFNPERFDLEWGKLLDISKECIYGESYE